MRPIWLSPAALSLLTLVAATTATATETWPGFRGPDPAPTGVLPEGSFGLVVEWEKDLGSGYSSFAISGDTLVTAFTSGENDVLAAFDRATGGERWRTILAEKYAGHDGSDDGPLATPRISGSDVFMLAPFGQLVALSLEDGRERWRVQLDESNSTVPDYGYTSSPVTTEELVVIATGGEGRAVTAFDRETGEVRWTAGDDSATYQAVTTATLAGREQIVAVTDQMVWGLDPADGAALWSERVAEGNVREGGSHPTVIDDHHVLVDLNAESKMFRVSEKDGALDAEEVWSSRAFARSWVLPVHHEGALYGFTGQILTAADAETGEIHWRSRGTSGQNLTLLDGHLVVLDASGELVVAEANPEEYREVSRIPVFEQGDYADAAFADGRFYVRNLEKLAAVRIDRTVRPQVAQAEVDPLRHAGELGKLVKKWEAMPVAERQAAVDSWHAGVESFPLTSESGLATIVYKGDVEDVALGGNTVFGWTGRTEPLHRVEGTDLFYRSIELDPKGNYEYGLSVDFERPGPDPANPHTVEYGFGPQSELRMPGWRANPMLSEPAEGIPTGQLEQFQFTSETLGSTRQVQVWLPPNYDASGETSYPLLVVHHGDQAVQFGHLENLLTNLLAAAKIEPLVAVMLPRVAGPEYNGPLADDYLTFLTTEMLPHVERHYRVTEDAAQRAVMGIGSAGVISVHAALAHPGTFGKVAAQSFYLGDPNRDAFWELVETTEAEPSLIWIETGPNDYDIPQNGIDAERSSTALAEKLEKRGFPVTVDIVHGTAGWAGWRGQTDRILEALFPAGSSEG